MNYQSKYKNIENNMRLIKKYGSLKLNPFFRVVQLLFSSKELQKILNAVLQEPYFKF